jgi:type VI secretion system secreted protein VgrG
MEEEGIFYFFVHNDGSHQMVVANTPQSHPETSPSKVEFHKTLDEDEPDLGYVGEWSKVQELRSGKYLLWDHCFELPHQHLAADKGIQESVQVGKVTHSLQVGGNGQWEIYDWPGEYAQRFDGIDRGGGDQPAELQKIFEDNKRTVGIRMQQEAAPSVVTAGGSSCRQFSAGQRFTLQQHFNGDGPYVLTEVRHSATQLTYRSGGQGFNYHNSFACIPLGLPFRPPLVTPKPISQGTQTAVVVGPQGEEIFTDKYGRVKVQFHWDRDGKNDIDSSCWLRVATSWAGKNWGIIYIPRVGQEVVVAFEEGDPDRPIIIGSVFNAEMMPPFPLPDKRTQSGLRTRSTPKGDANTCNELRFEDKKGAEFIYLHAERDFQRIVENNDFQTIGKNQTIIIQKGKTRTEASEAIELKVGKNKIKIDQSGITISATVLKLEGEVQTQLSGLVTQVKGEGALKLGGGMMQFEGASA